MLVNSHVISFAWPLRSVSGPTVAGFSRPRSRRWGSRNPMALLPRSFDASLAPNPPARLRAGGKFLFAGAEKLTVRGVTYGTFRPTAAGDEFPEPTVVERDFRLMAANGINAVRTYTPPP